jgi:ABC-type transporter Mla subunit MlaD
MTRSPADHELDQTLSDLDAALAELATLCAEREPAAAELAATLASFSHQLATRVRHLRTEIGRDALETGARRRRATRAMHGFDIASAITLASEKLA